jgi:putative ABC transport system permease protein
MTGLMRDLQIGVRMLLKRPGTTILAAAAIALGIGLTTTMFSIVDAAFLRGLPFDRPGELVAIGRQRANDNGFGPVPPHDFVDFHAAQRSFQDIAGATGFQPNVSIGSQPPERYRGARITWNTLSLLRTRPQIGRDFVEADARADAPPVVLISHTIWVGKFDGARDVVGKTIRANNITLTIVGVMPPKFGYPNQADIWVAERIELPVKRGEGRSLDVIGRLKKGVSPAEATAEMKTIARQLEAQYPENKDQSAVVMPYTRSRIGPQIIATLSTMLAAVFGVLLIACVNVTNLQLARAAERMKEMAVRCAIGATRWRIVRQLLIEGLMLSAAGAVAGLAIAYVGTTLFANAIVDTNPPFWIQVYVNGRAMALVGALTMIAALASSLIPALRIARQDLNGVLKDEGRSSTGLRVGFFSRALVVVEMTLSFVLLVVSGLMVKSVINSTTVTYPFDTSVLAASVTVPDAEYRSFTQAHDVMDRMRNRLAAVPGVTNVAIATGVPDNGGGAYPVTLEGEAPAAAGANRPNVRLVDISPEYFDVLGVRLREGRTVTPADAHGTGRVAIVNDAFVKKFFPKGDALGKRIKTGPPTQQEFRTVVGVVPDLVVARQPGDIFEVVYSPFSQNDARFATFFMSSALPAATISLPLRRAMMEVDPNLALFNINVLRDGLDQRYWHFRVFGGLFMTFGVAALVMSAAGLYGVMSFAVRRRTQEIGVRMALGADRQRITRMVVRQGLWQVGIGMAVGFGGGGFLGGALTPLLFNVKPWDPIVFAGTIAVLGTAGLLASYIPAIRAASVDPMLALRKD